MRAEPPPFSDTELAAAFPEMQIVLPELGSGSFKAAYRVVTATGDAVLKVVKEPASLPQNPGDDALPPRLDREIAAMQRVNSRRVVKVLGGPDIREIGGAPYVWYLEPFYGGGTLEALAGLRLSEQDGLLLADALLEGVDDLWRQARLVHRDIKPGNVVFGPDGPVLLDLGIALHVDLTPLTNAFAFSPRTSRYAAPEQFEVRLSAPIDSRTDQFLVGIVVFEAVIGSHPFDPDEPSGYLNRLMQGQLDDAGLQTLASVPMQQVLRRLLRAKPHERYRTAAQARRAVQGCLP